MQEYEIRVAGPVGPAAASGLPGFTTSALPRTTVLSGGVTSADDLRRVLDLLLAHGFTPFDIQIDPEVMSDPVGKP
jgi:hypothetical protein